MRRFPPPWTVEKIAGGFKVLDANGQSLEYVYSREAPDAAHLAKAHSQQHRQAAKACSKKGVRSELPGHSGSGQRPFLSPPARIIAISCLATSRVTYTLLPLRIVV
jgi:hypothetical protein